MAAEWSPPEERGRRKLKAMGEGDKEDVLQLLEDSLAAPRLRETTDMVRRRYLSSVTQDVEELLPHLQRRADVLDERARRKLVKRGEKEAEEMVAILEAQRERIQELLKTDMTQRAFRFMKDELRQLEADRRYWPKRLQQIEFELEDEPRRIQSSYDVKVTRLEPVGLVYLAPVSG